MQCTSCKHQSNSGEQCSPSAKNLNFASANIAEVKWSNIDSLKSNSCCQTQDDNSELVTLEVVLMEVRDIKSQLAEVPKLAKDVTTLNDKISGEFSNKMVDLTSKISDLEDRVFDKEHMEQKVSSLQNQIAYLKAQILGAQRSRDNSVDVRGVSTKKVEKLFSKSQYVSKKRPNNKPSKIFYGMASNIIKYAFLIFRTYLDLAIDMVFGFFWDSRQMLPALEKRHAVLRLSAVELAEKIRKQEIKSEDVVTACVERIKLINPILNAVTDERFDEAIEEAKDIDKKIKEGLPDEYFKEKPFLGVPFTAKESHAVSGLLHTLGTTSRRHVRAPADAECVRLLRRAGGIPVAVTNVPEINKWQETRNLVFGQTNNPYHTGRTTGGSSGGEVAVAAAYGSPISLCSDIGGSTRMPAFYCGLFGHNPTAGHTSLKGSALRTGNDDTMASIGFASKHCRDLGPLTKVVAGDMADNLDLDRHVDLKKVKFYYVETAEDLRVSPICKDLRNAMSRVITHFTTEAASTETSPQKYYHRGFDYMYSLWRHCMTKESENFAALLTNNQGEANGLLELFRKLVGQSEYTGAAIMKLLDDQVLPKVDAEWAENLIKELKEDLVDALGSQAVLLFPSAPAPAPAHFSSFARPYNFAYWAVLNVLRLPATQVPLGLDSSGLPLGIQVVGGPRQDALCLAVAAHLEETFGGYVPACKIVQ